MYDPGTVTVQETISVIIELKFYICQIGAGEYHILSPGFVTLAQVMEMSCNNL